MPHSLLWGTTGREAAELEGAIKRFKAWREKWQVEEERAVRCLEKVPTAAYTTTSSPTS